MGPTTEGHIQRGLPRRDTLRGAYHGGTKLGGVYHGGNHGTRTFAKTFGYARYRLCTCFKTYTSVKGFGAIKIAADN